MSQFHKFTEPARKVLRLAQDEAWRLGHDQIDAEHLLLGLLREGGGVAARILSVSGVQLPRVRSAVEFRLGREVGAPVGEIGLTHRAKMVIELAVDEMRRLDHDYIGTEHILLGLVRANESVADGVLESLGVSMEPLRAEIERQLPNSLDVVHPIDGSDASRSTDSADRTFGPDRTLRGFSIPDDETLARLQAREWQYSDGVVTSTVHKFASASQIVLRFAREEARRFNHNYIGTEHLLLGLVREGDGVAARVLGNMGGRLPNVRSAVDYIIGLGIGEVVGEIDLTQRARKVIELAIYEAWLLHSVEIETHHLLLGLAREGEGLAAAIFAGLDCDLGRIRADVFQCLEQGSGLA